MAMTNHHDFSKKYTNMKNYYSLLFLICFSILGYSQKNKQKKADKLYNQKSYVLAASAYEKLKENQNLLQNLGDCYYYNGQMKDATRVYGKLFLTLKDSVKSETYFKYAQAIMGTGDYTKADLIMSEYRKYTVDTPNFISNLTSNVPYNYTLQIMTKNTTNSDFGLALYGNKVAFASSRNASNPQYTWDGKPYLDLYSATIDTDGQLATIEAFPKEINTKTHESNPTFSDDGKTMYFNRTNDKKVKVGDEKYASIKLFKAQLVDGKWMNIKELPFCSDVYSCEHPFLSHDEKKLYFSSDMPGSIGSFDIYQVAINDDGSFAIPVNLGPKINTIHREQFPFVSTDNTELYFASDGHQGIGGLDVFMSKIDNENFEEPQNLGATINSNADDFCYVVDQAKNKGFISSNRKGIDNLYAFQRIENAENYVLQGDVKDKNTKQLLPGTTVRLSDEKGNIVGEMIVGAKADYIFKTEPNTRYTIKASKELYIPYEEEFITNEEGKMRYSIELFMECYDDAEEIITKRDDGKVQIVLENIYFDLNKWEVKPEAAAVLDVLLALLVKYNEMEIQLGAHTDSRSSETFNLTLSKRRAAATLEYLVENGIDRKRLKSKGFGESSPLIKCATNCTEDEHSINRRCEFIILK
jgi:peptidoglycan-associated lipoprotein